MLKKIIFTAFAAGLVFGAQELAIKAKASSNSDANFEQAADESQLRVEECIQKDSSTVGMIECINAEFAVQDKLLNENYKKAMSVLNDENKKKLKDIQRKWVAYKEAKCPLVRTLADAPKPARSANLQRPLNKRRATSLITLKVFS